MYSVLQYTAVRQACTTAVARAAPPHRRQRCCCWARSAGSSASALALLPASLPPPTPSAGAPGWLSPAKGCRGGCAPHAQIRRAGGPQAGGILPRHKTTFAKASIPITCRCDRAAASARRAPRAHPGVPRPRSRSAWPQVFDTFGTDGSGGIDASGSGCHEVARLPRHDQGTRRRDDEGRRQERQWQHLLRRGASPASCPATPTAPLPCRRRGWPQRTRCSDARAGRLLQFLELMTSKMSSREPGADVQGLS